MFNDSVFMQLSPEEIDAISGGTVPERGLFGYMAYLVGVASRCTYEFCSGAMQYQASLPANLKK